MAKKKKNGNGKRSFTLPVAIVGGLIPGATVMAATASTGWQNMGLTASRIYTGYDPTSGKWSFGATRPGLQPIIIGTLIHKAASMIGINKAIAAAGIPIFRI